MPAAEQRPQQHQLGVAGVLVLIEQDHLVAGALARADLRVPGGDPRRQGHLVGVVEYLAGRLGRRVPLHHRQQLLPRPLRVDDLPNGPWYAARQRLDLGVEPPAKCGHVGDLAQVLGEIAGQLEHRRGHRLRRPDDLVHRPVVGGHDARGQLPGQRGGDEPQRRLEALAQRVVGDQPAGVGVVGTDHRVAAERVLGLGGGPLQLRPAQPAHPGPDPVGELGRGLPGEGEAENPVRADQAVGDQPDQAGRHRLALARAGSRDDRERPERRGDHRRLLRRRLGQPEQPGQLHRAVHDRAHYGIPADATDISRRLPGNGTRVRRATLRRYRGNGRRRGMGSGQAGLQPPGQGPFSGRARCSGRSCCGTATIRPSAPGS